MKKMAATQRRHMTRQAMVSHRQLSRNPAAITSSTPTVTMTCTMIIKIIIMIIMIIIIR